MNETVSKHTSGPWEVEGVQVMAGHHLARLVIAECCDGDDAEMEANARLIAAAPDLYEAALQMVEHFEEWDVDEDAFDGCVALLAAIAKAEGRTS